MDVDADDGIRRWHGAAGTRAGAVSAARDRDEVVVAVQSGWGWQIRCVAGELRGDATVVTYGDRWRARRPATERAAGGTPIAARLDRRGGSASERVGSTAMALRKILGVETEYGILAPRRGPSRTPSPPRRS